jgi:hypothetical protein
MSLRWNFPVALRLNREQPRKEAAMAAPSKPLKPDDFPLHAEADKIKKQDGQAVASTEDPAMAADLADRLNEDEDRREQDKWSA